MARSHAIWLVMYISRPVASVIFPVAAFTYKHEMRSWLEQHLSKDIRCYYGVWRIPDGDVQHYVGDILLGNGHWERNMPVYLGTADYVLAT